MQRRGVMPPRQEEDKGIFGNFKLPEWLPIKHETGAEQANETNNDANTHASANTNANANANPVASSSQQQKKDSDATSR